MAKNSRYAIFFPDWRQANPYQELLAKGIEKSGFRVDFLNFKNDSFLPVNAALIGITKPNVIHLHWINDYIAKCIWSSASFLFVARFLLIILDILIVKLRGIKVVWTVHNLISHESINSDRELFIRNVLAKLCKVIVHSDGAKETVSNKYCIKQDRISVIPHGNYIGYYPVDRDVTNNIANRLNINKKNKVYLFLGVIRRYKGVNDLVDEFVKHNDPVALLVIAGKVSLEEDKLWLESMAKSDPRIKLSLGFIPDSELCSYIDLASVVVLPFVNTLTSGSAILAMSYRKALILPTKGKVFSFPTDGIIYYSPQQGLKWAFQQASIRDLNQMGELNYRYINQYDFETVANKLVNEIYLL